MAVSASVTVSDLLASDNRACFSKRNYQLLRIHWHNKQKNINITQSKESNRHFDITWHITWAGHPSFSPIKSLQYNLLFYLKTSSIKLNFKNPLLHWTQSDIKPFPTHTWPPHTTPTSHTVKAVRCSQRCQCRKGSHRY